MSKYNICHISTIHSPFVQSQDNELMSLGKKDVIIINGGSNDIDNYNCEVNDILEIMHNLIEKYNNTNILIVNLTPRYDQPDVFRSKFDIQAFNLQLNNIVKKFSHASVVEMHVDRRFYTRHGLHMNYHGKEMFAKRTAVKIRKLLELPIPFPQNDESLTLSQTPPTDLILNEQSIVKDTLESADLASTSFNNPINNNI
jgi:hypothetical protein